MNKLGIVMIGGLLAGLPLVTRGQDINWQARAGIGYASIFGGVSNIEDRMGFHIGAIGGMDLTFKHFIIGYNVTIGFAKLCDSGFMGNPLGNIATAVLLGAYPKNITADISIGYQL